MNHVTIDLDKPSLEDLNWMHEVLEDFVKETESVIGQRILDNWQTESRDFVKVLQKKKFFNLIISFRYFLKITNALYWN